ncbi:MAG: discoidin domain-containing protein, partial [Clostridia bacterium]|nr:discoidin domain-containing protein [Clostridia bacterium]
SVLLRAGYTSGKVVLKAESEGLAAAQIELETAPDALAQLPGPAFEQLSEKPVYAADAKERYSPPQSLKLEGWFNLDLGRNKPCTASSTRPDTDPNNVNQGEIRQPWVAADKSLPQWWQVDMQEQRRVSGMSVKWLNDGLWYDFSILASQDGETWTNIIDERASGQSVAPVRFPQPVDTRFLRILVTGVTGGEPAGLLLVEVHGDTHRH